LIWINATNFEYQLFDWVFGLTAFLHRRDKHYCIVGTFFNGDLRAYDITNPYQPKEVGTFIPEGPTGSKVGSIQFNDVFIDERGIVYTVDRFAGGLYVLEMEF
jgi:hypothetical protein